MPAPFVWTDLIPSFVTAGTAIIGGTLQNRAAGLAADVIAAGGERAAEIQAATAEQQLELLRQIYNQDIRLSRPSFAVGQRALQSVARSAGIGLPSSTFTEAPQEIGPFTRPGATPGGTSSGFPALGENTVSTPKGLAGGALKGTLAGAQIGSFFGPIGAAVGAGTGAKIGAVASLFGRGRKEADQIVPSQNALTEEFGASIKTIKAKDAAGTLTQADWQEEIDKITPLFNQFQSGTQDFGRAGPGARESTAFIGNALKEWEGFAANAPLGRRHGGPVHAERSGAANLPFQNASPGQGLPFRSVLPAGFQNRPEGRQLPPPFQQPFTTPRFTPPASQGLPGAPGGGAQRYLVGEAGFELFDPNPPGPPFQTVGQNGPEVFIPPEDGNIIPNAQSARIVGQGSTAGAARIGGFRRPGLIPRQEGGQVFATPEGFSDFNRLFSPGALESFDPEGAARLAALETTAPSGTTGGVITAERTRVKAGEDPFALQDFQALQPFSDAARGGVSAEESALTGLPVGNDPTFLDFLHRTSLPEGISAPTDISQRFFSPTLNRTPATQPPADFTQPREATSFSPANTQSSGFQQPQIAAPQQPTSGTGSRDTTFTQLGKDIPTIDTPTDQPFGDWAFDNTNGIWWNAKKGLVYNPKTDFLSDPNDPDRGEFSRFEPGVGEAIQPFGEDFSFRPGDAGFQPFNAPFGFDAAGFQPFNERFEFNEEDLFKDPGFQFRFDQGLQAIERSASARGTLGTGRTLKELTRFGQGLASQEFAAAYSRASSEFDRASGQTRDAYIRAQMEFGIGQQQAENAYNRELNEFVQRFNSFEQTKANRFNILTSIAGGG